MQCHNFIAEKRLISEKYPTVIANSFISNKYWAAVVCIFRSVVSPIAQLLSHKYTISSQHYHTLLFWSCYWFTYWADLIEFYRATPRNVAWGPQANWNKVQLSIGKRLCYAKNINAITTYISSLLSFSYHYWWFIVISLLSYYNIIDYLYLCHNTNVQIQVPVRVHYQID